MNAHPYCCDRFAELTSDGEEPAFFQEKDGSWILEAYLEHDDCREIPGVRFCPFCGSRVDRPGLETARPWGSILYHQDGTPVRWRDLASDGIYNVDYESKISRADGVAEDGIVFNRLPDTRPLIVNDVQALHEDGTPVVMEDVKRRGGQYGFDKNTHVIRRLIDDYSPLEFIEVDLSKVDELTKNPAEAGPSQP